MEINYVCWKIILKGSAHVVVSARFQLKDLYAILDEKVCLIMFLLLKSCGANAKWII